MVFYFCITIIGSFSIIRKVFMKMLSTLADKGSLKNSFEAAADELLENEDMIKRSTKLDMGSGKGVNGNGEKEE